MCATAQTLVKQIPWKMQVRQELMQQVELSDLVKEGNTLWISLYTKQCYFLF